MYYCDCGRVLLQVWLPLRALKPVIFKEIMTVGHFQRGFIIDMFLCLLVPCWFKNDLCSHFQALLLKLLHTYSMIDTLLEKEHNQIVIS